MLVPRGERLFPIIAGPLVWSAYFLVAYVGAAIACAKAPEQFEAVKMALAGLGAGSVALVGLAAFPAWKTWRDELDLDPDHSLADGTRAGRRAFLGYVALLLCGLSTVAIAFTAAPLVFSGTCA